MARDREGSVRLSQKARLLVLLKHGGGEPQPILLLLPCHSVLFVRSVCLSLLLLYRVCPTNYYIKCVTWAQRRLFPFKILSPLLIEGHPAADPWIALGGWPLDSPSIATPSHIMGSSIDRLQTKPPPAPDRFPHTILHNRFLVGKRQRPTHILVVHVDRVQAGEFPGREQGSL